MPLMLPLFVLRWSRLRGAKWEPAEQTEAHVKTMEALAELNLTLPPDPETPNKPTESAGQILGEAVAGQSLIPSEVERVLAEKDDALRWNAALALMELQVELVRQFTVPAIELHKEWSDAGMHGRVLLLDDIIRRSVSLPGSNEKKSTYTGA